MRMRTDLRDVSAKEILRRIQLKERMDSTGRFEVLAAVSGTDKPSQIAREVIARAAYLFLKTKDNATCISQRDDFYEVLYWNTSPSDTRLEDIPLKQAAEDVMSLQEVGGVREIVCLITSTPYRVGRIYVTGSNDLARRLYYLANTVDPAIQTHKLDNGYSILRDGKDLRLSELPVEQAKKDIASLRECRGDEIVKEVLLECRKNRAVAKPFM